jgi:hypothetical protein
VQYGANGRAVIATMKPSGASRTVVANAGRMQGNGGPEYAPRGARIVFYRVTYNKNGQGIASSDLFVRSGRRNTNITAHSSAKFFGVSWERSSR